MLDTATETEAPRVARPANLTYTRRVLLEMLISRPVATTDAIIDKLWGHDPNGGPDNPAGVIRVHMTYLRRFLRDHGVTIESDYMVGYRIPEAMRDMARAALDAGTERRWVDRSRPASGGIEVAA